EVRTRWASLAGFRAADGGLAIDGEIHPPPAGALKLELRGGEGAARLRRPVTVDGGRFSATVPFDAVLGAVRERKRLDEDDEDEPREETDEADAALAEDDEDELRPEWELFLIGDGPPLRLALRAEAGDGAWPCGDRELALLRTPQGDATLTLAQPHAVLTAASWTADGRLRLAGETPPSDRPREFLLASRARGVVETLPLGAAATGGPFELLLEPGRIASLAGELPLPEGRWRLWTRVVGATDPDALAPVKLPAALDGRLPLDATVAGKPMYLIRHADGDAVLVVRPDLATQERGPYNQRRLQRTVYPARRAEPLTDTVVYSSFTGRQYSDNPRAIHEELVRRGAPLEHRWLVRDAAAVVPPTASVLRQGSEEAHAVMARARYVVFNDHFPAWFSRRPDQVCLQTWHGTPLKRLGFDVPRRRGGVLRHEDRWAEQEGNWQYVVSPNRFSTPILRDAYALTGELLETGYPRDDVLAPADRADRSRRLRERLGIPDGVRTVLYAPTFRDHRRDRRGRYRLDLQLDLARLREAVGPDTMILFRKHHYVFDTVPLAADGFVRDVSEYPDSTELLLAADVLLTDYSSIAVDYANTGRPMLFFTYDLETYQNEIRGFYLDYEATVPGPLLRTTDEVAEALRELDAVHAAQATRYDAFVQRFCELDDGAAAARVVDRVFAGVAEPAAGTGPAVSPGRA
ncbi:MAG: CDP-glycerol glycerophosphotransferase, partial [Solirubrobacteraceae bacterium]|nr:CDP-glycerol glycerophosphotransferase [Solirubrobacteraceae bacterium]